MLSTKPGVNQLLTYITFWIVKLDFKNDSHYLQHSQRTGVPKFIICAVKSALYAAINITLGERRRIGDLSGG